MSRNKHIIISNCILLIVVISFFLSTFIYSKSIPIYNIKKSQVIYSGGSSSKNVCLMFNVYENKDVVFSIIDVLNSYDAKATFFVGGCWADDNLDALKKIVESGNEIGNHGYFHKDHKILSYEKNREEILLTSKIIMEYCGVTPTLFAPPSGSFSDTTLEVAEELNYKVIMWSKDTIDWRDKDKEVVYSRATKNLKNGDFILMHPKEHTLLALPSILEYYKKEGYSVITVSQSLSV